MGGAIEGLTIFGPGLIGGSLLLAARERGLCKRLVVWSRDAAEREGVRRLGVADTVTGNPAEAVQGAALVLLCTPPAALAAVASSLAPHLAPGATVSDVASVKADLGEALTALFERPDGTGSRFVGSHPMAGGERGGLAAARADLFAGRACLLTPLAGRAAPGVLAAVEGFWRGLGMRTLTMDPTEHDRAVALVSHLPHLVSAALAGLPDARARACAGPGWQDMTRLAGGPPELWTEILSLNRAPAAAALRGMMTRLGEALELLEAGRAGQLRRFLEEAGGGRMTNDK